MSEERGMGDNSQLTEAERKAVFMDHFKPIAAQLEIVKEAQAEYKRLRKLAKADKVTLSDIDFALRCAEIDNEGIVVDRLRREAEIASWFALPVEFQPDMFGDFEREPAEDRARREGAAAGASGKGTNPYDENSPQGRAWADGWQTEQKKLAEAMQSSMEKKNAAKAAEEAEDDNPFEDAAE